MQVIDEEEQQYEEFFHDAALDPIKRAEEIERLDASKDFGAYQEELILLMNKFFGMLEGFFDGGQVNKLTLINQFRESFL